MRSHSASAALRRLLHLGCCAGIVLEQEPEDIEAYSHATVAETPGVHSARHGQLACLGGETAAALRPGRQQMLAAMEQARRYADEHGVVHIAASDGRNSCAADIIEGITKERVLVDLAAATARQTYGKSACTVTIDGVPIVRFAERRKVCCRRVGSDRS